MEKYKFMLVGVDKYKDNRYRSMQSITNDVDNFEEIIKKYFLYNELTVFKEGKTLKRGLEIALENFFVNCDKDDTLVLYWSGHGDSIFNEGVLVCSDSQAEDILDDKISMKKLSNFINETCAKAVIVIVDCCYSGKLIKSRRDSAEIEIKGQGKIIISSSSDEVSYSDNSNGIFTKYFLEEIKDMVELDGYSKIDITELYSKTIDAMEYGDAKQLPNLKATIQGRFYFTVNNLKMSLPNLPKGRNSSDRRSYALLHTLDQVLNQRNGIDEKHDQKLIEDYLNIELPVGKLKGIRLNELYVNRVTVNIEYYDWAQRLVPSQIYVTVSSREQAEEIQEAALRKQVNIYGYLSSFNNVNFFNKLVLKYGDLELEFEGIKSRTPVKELNLKDEILWFSYNHTSTELVVLTRSTKKEYSLVLISVDDASILKEFKLPLEPGDYILDASYYRFTDTCLVNVENGNEEVSILVYSMNSGFIKRVEKLRKKDIVIPINSINYLLIRKNILKLAYYDSDNVKEYKLKGNRLFGSKTVIHDFVTANKLYITYKDQLHSVEVVGEDVSTSEINIPADVIGIINEGHILCSSYDGLSIRTIKGKSVQSIKKLNEQKYKYYTPGVILVDEQDRRYYDEHKHIMYQYLTDSYSQRGDFLHARSLTNIRSVSYTGDSIACLNENNLILIWK